jgi:hypothetical protein
MAWVPLNVSMAPTCFRTVIDVPGAIRDADRAVRGGPFDLTSGRDGAICCRDCCRKQVEHIGLETLKPLKKACEKMASARGRAPLWCTQ